MEKFYADLVEGRELQVLDSAYDSDSYSCTCYGCNCYGCNCYGCNCYECHECWDCPGGGCY